MGIRERLRLLSHAAMFVEGSIKEHKGGMGFMFLGDDGVIWEAQKTEDGVWVQERVMKKGSTPRGILLWMEDLEPDWEEDGIL